MSTNTKKPWNTAWTTEEIRENASNWSLGCDVALLRTLERFSDDLFRKTQETDRNLNKLLQKLDETNLKLDITKNEFLSLHNRQFLESRVYEEDETVDAENEETKEKDVEKPKTEEEITAEMKDAVLAGLKIVDKYYYKSEVPANNSDYESDDSNSAALYALTLKDPYLDRPLPHVIGTQEWHKKWHIGLQESSSESENEAASEKFSDTDSETDLPVSNRTSQMKTSDTSSEGKPVANSTFGRDGEVLSESSGSELGGSVPVKTPISSVNFAEQLAAKLGNVINQQLPRGEEDDDEEEEVNTRPIQKSTSNRFSSGLFSDEPPPLDEDDDEEDMFDENAKKGLFSGGRGLFDNDEESVMPAKNQSVVSQAESKPEKKISSGLFDDEDEENDIFSTSAPKIDLKKPFLPNLTKPTSLPLFNDEPPELDEVDTDRKKQKPIGGVSVFGGANLFENKATLKKRDEYIKNDNKKSEIEEHNKEEKVIEQSKKKISLFDDDDNLFEDDLFSNITAKKFTSSLFDDVPPEDDDMQESSTKHAFDSSPPPDMDDWEIKSNEEKEIAPYEPLAGKSQSNIFNDEPPPLTDENKEDDQLFSNSTGLFDDNSDLFSSLKIPPPKREQVEEIKEKPQEVKSATKKSKLASLFDDDEDLDDDLFSSIKTVQKKKVEKVADESKKVGSETASSKNKLLSLFDDVNIPEEKDIFSEKNLLFEGQKKNEVVTTKTISDKSDEFSSKVKPSGLFDEEEKDIFAEKLVVNQEHKDPLFEDQNKSEVVAPKSKEIGSDELSAEIKSVDLFDKEEKDIFAEKLVVSQEEPLFEDHKKSEVVPSESKKIENERKLSGLFGEENILNFSEKSLTVHEEQEEALFEDKNNSEVVSTKSNADDSKKIGNDEVPSKSKLSGLFDEVNVSKVKDIFAKKTLEQKEPLFEGHKKNAIEDDIESQNGLNEKGGSIQEKSDISTKKLLFEDVVESESEIFSDTIKKAPIPNEKHTNETNQETSKPLKGSPGKLKHNLNINVGALMPGAIPPSFLVKSQSLEIKGDEEVKNDLPIQSSSEISLLSGSSEEKPILFESNEHEVETLKSVTKDRAKIPVKRRPSTRKARQEQIRRSIPDFKLNSSQEPNIFIAYADNTSADEEKLNFENDEKAKMEELFATSETPIPNAAIFTEVPSPEENSSGKKGKPLFTKEVKNKNEKKASLFDSLDSDSDDMFKVEKTKVVTGDLFAKDDGLFGTRKPPLKKSETIDIFNDGDDVDDIFSSKKLPPKSDIIKKSLFDDDLDDDEEDIFGAAVSKSTLPTKTTTTTEVKPQKATIRKLNATEMEDDPLSALMKD